MTGIFSHFPSKLEQIYREKLEKVKKLTVFELGEYK